MVAELGFCFLVWFFFLFFCLGGGGHFLFLAGEGAAAVCPEAGHRPEKKPNISSDRISRGWVSFQDTERMWEVAGPRPCDFLF